MALLLARRWTAPADSAWAKGQKMQAPEKQVKSWAMPYAAVMMSVTLGLILVLRPVKPVTTSRSGSRSSIRRVYRALCCGT